MAHFFLLLHPGLLAHFFLLLHSGPLSRFFLLLHSGLLAHFFPLLHSSLQACFFLLPHSGLLACFFLLLRFGLGIYFHMLAFPWLYVLHSILLCIILRRRAWAAKYLKLWLSLPFPDPCAFTALLCKVIIRDAFISECPFPNFRDAGRYANVLQRMAVSKRLLSDILHRAGNLYLCQALTAFECLIRYPAYAFRNINCGKAIPYPLIRIGYFPSIYHAFRLALQPSCVSKCLMANLFYAVWNYNLAQAAAAFKRIISYLCNSFWDYSG